MTGWTTREDLRGFLQRRWDRGDLLRSLAGEGIPFPWRIPLKTPRGVDLVERFDPVRAWVRDLREGRGYRLETKTLSHPLHGREEVPSAAWFDAPEDEHYWVQWSLSNTASPYAVEELEWLNGAPFPLTAGADVDAPRAWTVTRGDPSVVVAVMDTGPSWPAASTPAMRSVYSMPNVKLLSVTA